MAHIFDVGFQSLVDILPLNRLQSVSEFPDSDLLKPETGTVKPKKSLAFFGILGYKERLDPDLARWRGPQPNSSNIWKAVMSRVCQVTGKRPLVGNNVSHSNIKSKKRSLPNLHSHRFWVERENRWVKLRVSAKGLRIIDKNGIDAVLADMRAAGQKI